MSEQGEVYGYVLVLRNLAAGACVLGRHPAALRVLCVLAEYVDADGKCRVGHDTIAARLEISRQAVAKHITVLISHELLTATAKPGAPMRYQLGLLDVLKDRRFGSGEVDMRREAKRLVRARERGAVIVRFNEREGYAAYKAFMDPRMFMAAENKAPAMAAMIACEAALGCRYELYAEPDDAASLWKRVQLNEVATGATSEVATDAT